MSTISSLPAQPLSYKPVVVPARPRLAAGRLFALAIVTLIGIAVGVVLAIFVAVFTGLLQISC